MTEIESVTRLKLPVLPLREVVLFPGVTAPIGAGRPGTLRAIEAALTDDQRLIFAVSQKENVEQVEAEDLYTMGTVARIGQIQRGIGGVQLLLHGEYRANSLQYGQGDGYLEAIVNRTPILAPVDPDEAGFLALCKETRERASELGRISGLGDDVVKQVLKEVSEPGAFADLVAGYIDISPAERQALLETLSVEARLRKVLVHVQRQIELYDVQEDIKSKVQEELGERQREMLLREQLKAIRKELGEGDDEADTDELLQLVKELDLPDEVRKEVDREVKRLERSSRESMDAQVIRTYLETITELPWNEKSKDHLDLVQAEEILGEDHYGLQDVKDRVLEFLAVRQLRDANNRKKETPAGNEDDKQKAPILLFVGPPGVGKTSIAQSIARAMGRKYVRISLGGARDEADIRGHRRTYVGAMPGRIIQGMKTAGTKNPVFLLDELDKLGVSFQGDPAAALLEVLDPAQNDTFVDHYLGVPFDLSEVLFIATANLLNTIPGPLLDRMETVEFSSYSEREKLEIARRYLVPRQINEAGLSDEQFSVDDEAIKTLISNYTREAGVRQFEREFGRVARKVARKIAAKEVESVAVGADEVSGLLGRPKVRPEKAFEEDQVGVASGMYYTPAGGDIMFVEVSVMPGKGELVLTGHMGEVMKESARAALTCTKTFAAEFGIAAGLFAEKDIHIHVPAGAIPKDGPSAGVAMATALVSALSGIPVRHDVAMTGELTLSGRVLPIGGVKEKVLGACRAGIDTILLPKDNLADLEDISPEERKRINAIALDSLGDALRVALRRQPSDGSGETSQLADAVGAGR